MSSIASPDLLDVQVVHIDAAIVRQLERSFDTTGSLNTKTYPQLEDLRKEIERIGASVTKTMDELVQNSKFSNMLQVCASECHACSYVRGGVTPISCSFARAYSGSCRGQRMCLLCGANMERSCNTRDDTDAAALVV